jgi:ethanolamine ammonia-lyase large subunit
MGVDVCYTNHLAADQNSADNLLLLLAAAGCNYFMGVPCADDVMLNYQSTSFHDALAVRQLFGLRQAPEFAAWLEAQGWWAAPPAKGEGQLARERMLQQLDTVLDQAKRVT